MFICVCLWNFRNNAGVMFCPFQLIEDGIESQFATNHIGKISFSIFLIEKLYWNTELFKDVPQKHTIIYFKVNQMYINVN